MPTLAEARARLCDPAHEVSAHWLIGEAGEVEALVPEDRRAWHAGAGGWAGITDVNSHSIGVELANPGDRPFPEAQMAALETLLAAILARWRIPPHRVIAHSDMAPERKRDPGPRFDWRRLALDGLAAWPKAVEARDFIADLRQFGFPEASPEVLLNAFRLHFRPWADGPQDETDASLAAGLARIA